MSIRWACIQKLNAWLRYTFFHSVKSKRIFERKFYKKNYLKSFGIILFDCRALLDHLTIWKFSQANRLHQVLLCKCDIIFCNFILLIIAYEKKCVSSIQENIFSNDDKVLQMNSKICICIHSKWSNSAALGVCVIHYMNTGVNFCIIWIVIRQAESIIVLTYYCA